MLTVRLDPETEQKLADIIAHEQDVNRSSLVKRLILERWLTLNLDNTFVERRGGHPEHLLQDAPPDLSERSTRKQAISDYLKQRHSWFIRRWSWSIFTEVIENNHLIEFSFQNEIDNLIAHNTYSLPSHIYDPIPIHHCRNRCPRHQT